MRKNAILAFLFFFSFWGGICWILFNIKVGILAGLTAGTLGMASFIILYLFLFIETQQSPKKEK